MAPFQRTLRIKTEMTEDIFMMKNLVAVLSILASLFATPCHSQVAEIKPVTGTVVASSHLVFPPLPDGYRKTRQQMVFGGEKVGVATTVSADHKVSKVLAKVFLNRDVDFSKREYRAAAFKGYVNGFVDSLKEAGYKTNRLKAPSLPESDIISETVEVEFVNDEEDTLWVHKRVFFDSRGFDITVVADNEDSFAELKAWSAKITASEIETPKIPAEPVESPNNEQPAHDLEIADLQGEWKVEAVQIGEKQFPSAAGIPKRLLFENNTLRVDAGEKNQDKFSKMKLELIGGQPMKVNFVRNRNGNAEVLPGILELTNGKLRVGLPLVPAKLRAGEVLKRPKAFDDRSVPFMLMIASHEP